MLIRGRPSRTIWPAAGGAVEIVDQTRLPHAVEIVRLTGLDDAVMAIATMKVRGAPLIGVTAAWGLALALRADPSDAGLAGARARLVASRPTAVNLAWALERIAGAVAPLSPAERADAAAREAADMAEADIAACRAIGEHGAALIAAISARKAGGTVNILTHCNAGWLAAVDWGTALAPIYVAQERGVEVHVWVDETRPRNQGAALTAFELGQQGVAHTVIVDNAGGHLMQRGRVDLVLVGADRITRAGDVANKIGTYLKALAAADTGVPFHVAAPSSTIDWPLTDGIAQIPIEERDGREVTHAVGALSEGERGEVRIAAPGSGAANFAFDVTPARLVTGLITERGRCAASETAIADLFPEFTAVDPPPPDAPSVTQCER
ncbi:MAG: S-methyl-5-thioribose-1-phosphate isomerase, partial [Caulobacteraceae bacterium]